MISVNDFLMAVSENAARVTEYVKGKDGTGGKCDCVGLIIGALRLAGVKYSGTHGSNYFARHYTIGLRKITNVSELLPGDLVYKASKPGDEKYNLPSGYKSDSDQQDYYHIGVVMSSNPLQIAHCSSGGMHYDTRLGNWTYFGRCKGVDYDTQETEDKEQELTGTVVVDVPNDGTVNVRKQPGTSATMICKLPEGTKVDVIESVGQWMKVEFKQVGYIMTKYLRKP